MSRQGQAPFKECLNPLDAAKAIGFLIAHPSDRRLRAAWRQLCERAAVAHMEAIQHAHTFELRLDVSASRRGLSRDAGRAIDSVFALAGFGGSAGTIGAYAAAIPRPALEPVARVVLGIIGIERYRSEWAASLRGHQRSTRNSPASATIAETRP